MTAREVTSHLDVPQTPTAPGHAASKKYVDDQIAGVLTGNVTMESIDGLIPALNAKIDKSILDAKGDILIGTADNTPGRLTVGVDGTVLKADSTKPEGLTWGALNKAAIGLANVDNTADSAKPVSTAQQAALDLKQRGFVTGTVSTAAATAAKAVTIAGYTPQAGDWLLLTFTLGNSVASPTLAVNGGTAWPLRGGGDGSSANVQMVANQVIPFYFTGAIWTSPGPWYNNTYSTITQAEIINTASTSARLMSGQQAENLMANEATKARTLTQKTLTSPVINTPTGIVKGDVGLGNVDNTSDANKPVSTAQAAAIGTKADATATANALAGKEPSIAPGTTSQFWRGDKTWQTVPLDKAGVGLGNVDNTSDANKPVSTAQQAALNLKANDNAVVHLAGDEVLTGTKTFPEVVRQQRAGVNAWYSEIDSGGHWAMRDNGTGRYPFFLDRNAPMYALGVQDDRNTMDQQLDMQGHPIKATTIQNSVIRYNENTLIDIPASYENNLFHTDLYTMSPESADYTHIPHLFNDVAYNLVRGGSVALQLNGGAQPNGGDVGNFFSPDTTACSLYFTNASDVWTITVGLCRGFDWTATFGIAQHPNYRAKNIKLERYTAGTGWQTVFDYADQGTGHTKAITSGWGGSDPVTQLRYTLANPTSGAGNSIRVTNLYAMSYDSKLLDGSFMPMGGGTMYGPISYGTNPTDASHLTRKGYVDSAIAAAAPERTWAPEMVLNSGTLDEGYNDMPGGIAVEPGPNANGVFLDSVWVRLGAISAVVTGGSALFSVYVGTKNAQGTLVSQVTLPLGTQDQVAVLGTPYSCAANAVVRVFVTVGSSTISTPVHFQCRGRYKG
ncbi:hypothetical protein KHO57_gp220 [Mycobacterium phage Phabba]|uniref:Minor tail protein n=1 Tax=Mycobacterium phage Phabba TaxID=2027899 RepID=A0A249XTZ8_9CAUD|nr:hypothetical protein KHO57_gp220 [Mycobacterium phage Phabba]ASZ74684.1 hypothetical protein SEA_PHABBA_115 [Mycobacterium phage Phabba]